MKGLISRYRDEFHVRLITQGTWSFSPFNKFGESLIASNADSGQRFSVVIANELLKRIVVNNSLSIGVLEKKKEGQTVGQEFEIACSDFIRNTFSMLDALRPGQWSIERVPQRNNSVLGKYEQYSHLNELAELATEFKTLKNFLGDGYTIAPDIVLSRLPVSDDEINRTSKIIDSDASRLTMLLAKNHNTQPPKPLLHASISCKFTMRSDRSQNTRTEALNLIRTRKGRTPHIVAITAEPTASRISSLALGTGDMDCVYHFALYELVECYKQLGLAGEESLELLTTMIEGKRLRDISDLPLDLAI